MYISKKVILVILVSIVLLVSCSAANPKPLPQYDPACPTGVSMYEVPVYTDDLDVVWEVARAFIIRPNEGCNVPVQYCTFIKSGYGAGLSCTDLK